MKDWAMLNLQQCFYATFLCRNDVTIAGVKHLENKHLIVVYDRRTYVNTNNMHMCSFLQLCNLSIIFCAPLHYLTSSRFPYISHILLCSFSSSYRFVQDPASPPKLVVLLWKELNSIEHIFNFRIWTYSLGITSNVNWLELNTSNAYCFDSVSATTNERD